MNAILSAAVAKTLLNSLWEGAVVALVLAVVLWLVRSPRVRYVASCVAMLLLVGSFAATFVRFAPRVAAPVQVAPMSPVVRSSPVSIETAPVPPEVPVDYTTWIAPLWMAGVAVFYLRASVAWIAERRLRRSGVCMAPELWRARMEQLQARVRLARPVVLLESSIAEVPMVVGYLRPIVLVPVGLLTAMPVSQVEAILLHELAHIRRYDYLVNLLQVFVEGLLFYHPAVWWISAVMRTERETCCDDAVVAVSGDAYEYAAALENLERRRATTLALAATDGNLLNRIGRLLGKPGKRSSIPGSVLAVAILGLMPLGVTRALQPVKPAAPQARSAPPAISAPEKPVLPAQVRTAPAVAKLQPVESTGERRIAVGDLLVFSVYEQPEMSKSQTVNSDGTITFPFLGSLHTAGKTTSELRMEIMQSLMAKNLMAHPAVEIGIGEAAPREVAVSGSVKNPGRFAISGPITVLNALAKAGWLAEDAGSQVVITRLTPGEREETTIEYLQTNPLSIRSLVGGESITMSTSPRIWVSGNVARSGAFRLSASNATLLRAIELAGGSSANDAEAYIYRALGDRPRFEIAISLSAIRKHEVEDVPLVANDVVLVPKDTEDLQKLAISRLQMLILRAEGPR